MDRSSVDSTRRPVFVVQLARRFSLLWSIIIFFLQLTCSAHSSSLPSPSHQLRHQSPQGLYYSPVRWTKVPQTVRQGRPVDVMTDVVNDLGAKILDRYLDNTGNVAFSPSGLGFVLVALYEGAAGSSSREISDVLGLPRDRRVVRIGLRDIHRRLRSYLNADAFLGGLTLNRDDINLRPDYEETLRFYGFDISDSGAENATTPGDVATSSTDSPPTSTTMNPDPNATLGPTLDTTSDDSTPATGLNDAAEVVTNVTGEPSSAMTMPTNGSLSTTPLNLTLSTITSLTNITTPTNVTATTPMSTDSTTPGTLSSSGSPTMLANAQTAASNNSSSTNTPSTIMPMSSLVGTPSELPNTQTQSSNGSITTPMTRTLTTVINSTPTSSQPSTSVSTAGSTSTSSRNATNANSTGTLVDNPTTNVVEDTATNVVRKRRGLPNHPAGYFTSTADDGIWLDEYGRFNTNHDDYQSQKDDVAVDPKRQTEIAFLVNGCDYSRVTGAVYTAFLPFSYFPSLQASLLEFPLDDPRYKILIMLPSDENGTRRLARTLATKPITLRNLRRSLQSSWVTAVVPSFMLRGFVTLTPYLERALCTRERPLCRSWWIDHSCTSSSMTKLRLLC
ncbi:uncharacterized protein Spn85F isoform X2 [Venturia canescens]|uniref:uncharacterized protein Spn85F isoform X2 n=1 Tax=Venturia canescens TaxID=32260 RepID=UPI001C9CD1B8|nr:uncharacterized protein LOC122411577 isoform X2 [Venturia canescens]